LEVSDEEREEEDEEEEEEESLAPRPLLDVLSGCLSNPSTLTNLHLCKPVEPGPDIDTFYSLLTDDNRDQLALSEWISLLQSVKGTIVEVILDHRQTLIEIDLQSVGADDDTPLLKGARSDLMLCEQLLPIFLEGGWPSLRRLEFRGIQILQSGFLDSEEKLRQHLPSVEIKISPGRYMFYKNNAREGDEGIHHYGHEDGLLCTSY
jgi:hypothetical protein